MFDIIIKDIKIIDGTGNPGYKSDVGILKGKIEYIGKIRNVQCETTIDGADLVLTPGFIDAHSHTDLNIFDDTSAYSKLIQGVTTEITGNCGLTLAPVSEGHFDELKKYLAFGTQGCKMTEKWPSFTTFGRYLDEVEKQKLGINLGFFVGHGSIRLAVMGFENRRANSDEMGKMKDLLKEAMEAGAIGMTSGLIYPPGVFTPKDEIVELCKVISEYGGIYASHIRNESHDVINAVNEAIEIGRLSGIPVHISHHKISGKSNWGNSDKTLKLIDDTINEGFEVTLDQYPYTAGQTNLGVTLPPEYYGGGLKKMVERLCDKSKWGEIKEDILNPQRKWENFVSQCGFENMLVLSANKTQEAEGKTIAEYAAEKHIDPFEALFSIMALNEGDVNAAFFTMNEMDIENIMKYPFTMVGSDAGLLFRGMSNHPRFMGSFPRVLGRYVRDKKVLRIEEAIRKMTSLTALKMGLKTKGLIKEGFDADIVIFDPDKITDRADYKKPNLPPEGIKYVIVNGKVAIKDNNYMNSESGKVIRIRK